MRSKESSILWHLFCISFGFWLRCFQKVFHLFLRVVKGSRKGTLPPIKDPLLLEPAVVLAAKIRTRKVKSETVVRAYVDRIRSVNPMLNAVVEDRFSAAIDDAKGVDSYISTCNKTPEQLEQEKPFLGVPFTTKDAIPIKGLALTAGVVARKGTKAKEDSVIMANMRAAGAIPLCVTNVCEACMWIDGSNRLYGTTNNPYDLTRTPGGSSGGEGALVGAGASVFGLGNDIGGSVRVPCSFCGIFGHKPTRRVLSNKGQWPSTYETERDHFNCTGPMCRYAVDLIPMMKIMAGENISKINLDAKVNMKTLKVYYTEDYMSQGFTTRMDPEIRDTIREVVKKLEVAHGIRAQKVSIPLINKAWSIWVTKIGTAKVPVSLEDMVTNGRPESFHLYLEFVKWFFRVSNHTLHILYFITLCRFFNKPHMKDTNEENHKLYDQLTKTFTDMLGDNGVFIFPTNCNTPNYHQEIVVKFSNYAYTGLFSFLGNPVSQCPIKLSSEGLPIGVQVVGNHHHDHLTLAVAKELEVLFGGWKSPSPILK